MTAVDLSVLIVNWNAERLLRPCLASVLAHSDDLNLEICLVDNASSDGSVAIVLEEFPAVRLIANQTNVGFAAANNQAARETRGRHLLLLNPDTEIRPNALSRLVACADNTPQLGALGPRLVNPDGTWQRSCWRGYPGIAAALIDALYLWKLAWLPVNRLSEYGPTELGQKREVGHLLGACMLIPRVAWDRVGPLDEGYFLFLEETDWCLRAHQAGLSIEYLPTAEVVHYGQHSMRQQPVRNLMHLYESYCRFYRRSQPGRRSGLVILKLTLGLAVTLRLLLWGVRSLRASSPLARQSALQMAAGYGHVLRALPSL